MKKSDGMDGQAKALIIQKHQLDNAQAQIDCIDSALKSMSEEQDKNQEILNQLLLQAQTYIEESHIIIEASDGEDIVIDSRLYVDESEVSFSYQEIQILDHVSVSDSINWDQYLDQVETYASRHDIEFEEDPFKGLMSASQRIELEKRIKDEFSLKGANCDKYDYMIAGTCGLIGGLIDVLFVGVPGSGGLTRFTDNLTNTAVQKFARLNGWKGPREGKDPMASAIGFLERNYKVNYDHRHGGDVDGLFKMSTKNHHIKSLAHSPDLVGLFFSILDQFSSTAHFVDNGKIIAIDTDTFELKGSNFSSKIFSGFVNWLGHLFSDVAGSSGAQGRGSGIPMPFYSLLQFINVGKFKISDKVQHRQTFAKIAVRVFEQGYDLRHGMALAIPVLITELLTRITWSVKQRFYHEKDWEDCVPSANNPELRRMLLIAHGSLCLVDTADAALRSGGFLIPFMLRANLIAWARFGTVALKELRAWYREGDMDIESVDLYLDMECQRLLAA